MLRVLLRIGLLISWASATSVTAGSFTWSGPLPSGSNDFTNSANWIGGTAPPNDGTADLFFSDAARLNVAFSGLIAVNSIQFNNAINAASYYFDAASPVTITLAGGINTASPLYTSAQIGPNVGFSITADQDWTVSNTASIATSGAVSGSGRITKRGGGSLFLSGDTTNFSGGITIAEGAVYANRLGSGPIAIESLGMLSVWGHQTVTNAIELHSGARLGLPKGSSSSDDNELSVTGVVTVADVNSTIRIGDAQQVDFNGGLVGAIPHTQVKFSDGGVAVLTAATSNVDTFTVDASRLIFDTVDALPAYTTLYSINEGYIGMTESFDGFTANPGHGSPSDIVGKIGTPSTYRGTIGFDTDPTSLVPSTFHEAGLDLSTFTDIAFHGLGSATNAVLDASLVPFYGTNLAYRFGGGGGRLVVQGDLALNGTAGLWVISPTTFPLTLVLQGSNAFAGSVYVEHSLLILDSQNAFPFVALQKIELGASGYVSGTENWGTGSPGTPYTPASLLGVINANSVNATSIMGFDSSQPATVSRVIASSSPIDFGILASTNASLAALPYLGTTTSGNDLNGLGLRIDGLITVPNNLPLKLAGINGGILTVTSDLAPANGITSVVVGHPDSKIGLSGMVSLTGNNTYTGGTTLLNGTLKLSTSSVVNGGNAIVSGPLGTGRVQLGDGSIYSHPKITILPPTSSAGSSDITLHNPIAVNGSTLSLGEGDSAGSLTLLGAISGSGLMWVMGDVTLGAANPYSGFVYINRRLTVNNDDGLRAESVRLFSGSMLQLLSSAPEIYDLSANYASSSVVLGSNTHLTVNTAGGSTTAGRDVSFAGVLSGANASLTKSGAGTLTLSGANTYSGGTDILGGKIVAGNTQALGTSGTVRIAGGALMVSSGVTVAFNNATHPLNFDHGKLGGAGTLSFDSTVHIKGNANGQSLLVPGLIAPANLSLVFSNGAQLSLEGGGALHWRLMDAKDTATGWSSLTVTGNVDIAATSASPFNFVISTVDANGSSVSAANFNAGAAYSWTVLTATAITFSGSGSFDSAAFNLSSTDFLNAPSGNFTLSLNGAGTSLLLNFSPSAVPEPSTWALLTTGLIVLGISIRRRKSQS